MSRNIGNCLLLDTNILLDILCPGRPQHAEANRVIELCNGGGDMGFATAGSLKDAYYLLTRQIGEKEARNGVDILMGLLVIAPLSAEDCDLALHSDEPDFEDGLIRACAELNDIDFILTRDAAAFQRSKVRSMDCAAYLSVVKGL